MKVQDSTVYQQHGENKLASFELTSEEVNWRCYYLLFKISFYIGRKRIYSSGALGNTLLIQTLPNIQQIQIEENRSMGIK